VIGRPHSHVFRVALLVSVLALHLSCATALDVSDAAATEEPQRTHVQFADETGQRLHTLQSGAHRAAVTLCIRTVLQDGAAVWTLDDGEGQSFRWTGQAQENSPYRAAQCFESPASLWHVMVTLADATGEYELVWHIGAEATLGVAQLAVGEGE
jgi:hypothetical protein